MQQQADYVLGTHDEELARLGLQHQVWRPRALDAWQRAGFAIGQTLLDVGCGPGYATRDLAEIVGASGRVIAIDQSERFLGVVSSDRGLGNIHTRRLDLDRETLGELDADGAWVRWVFAFLTRPRDLVNRLASALRPGARLVIHEYLDYATWRFSPRSAVFEEFVRTVMRSWRDTGGEPDVGLDLLTWLPSDGFELQSVRTIVDVVSPSDFAWQWPKRFVDVGLNRLVELGEVTGDQASVFRDEFALLETTPNVRLVTPAVVELIAVRR